MFCFRCGNSLPDGSAFCNKCGTSIAADQPVNSINNAAPPETIQIVPEGKNIRFRCHACKNVADVKEGDACPKCGAAALPGGYIKLHRIGAFNYRSLSFGIYINQEPHGHIANKQTCWIRVPFGTHKIHIAQGWNRNCKDATITISPDHPLEACKISFKAGLFSASFAVEEVPPSEIPD